MLTDGDHDPQPARRVLRAHRRRRLRRRRRAVRPRRAGRRRRTPPVRRRCRGGRRVLRRPAPGSTTAAPGPSTWWPTSVLGGAGGRRHVTARSSYLVLQAVEGFPLQPIVTGRYVDRFAPDADGCAGTSCAATSPSTSSATCPTTGPARPSRSAGRIVAGYRSAGHGRRRARRWCVRSDVGHVATLTLDRPGRAQRAVGRRCSPRWPSSSAAVDADPSVHVVVLAGNGPAFSAGHDLREIHGQPRPGVPRAAVRPVLRRHGAAHPAAPAGHRPGGRRGHRRGLPAGGDAATWRWPARRPASPRPASTSACSAPRRWWRSPAPSRPKHAMELLLTGELIDAPTRRTGSAWSTGWCPTTSWRRPRRRWPPDRRQVAADRRHRQGGLLAPAGPAAGRRLRLHVGGDGPEPGHRRCHRGHRRLPRQAHARPGKAGDVTAADDLRPTLFGDLPMEAWPQGDDARGEPWARFVAAREDVADGDQDLAVRGWAGDRRQRRPRRRGTGSRRGSFLRGIGVQPDPTVGRQVFGVVAEVAVEGRPRRAGRLRRRRGPLPEPRRRGVGGRRRARRGGGCATGALVAAGQALADHIGPWTEPASPPARSAQPLHHADPERAPASARARRRPARRRHRRSPLFARRHRRCSVGPPLTAEARTAAGGDRHPVRRRPIADAPAGADATWITRLDPDQDPLARPDGLRLAVKDCIDVAGVITTAGSPAVAAHRRARRWPTPPASPGARAAGARIVGKANLHELCFGAAGRQPALRHAGQPARPPPRARAGRRAGRRWRWPPARPTSGSAPTPPARSATRRRAAASPASRPLGAWCR